jgi:hypothetical protein
VSKTTIEYLTLEAASFRADVRLAESQYAVKIRSIANIAQLTFERLVELDSGADADGLYSQADELRTTALRVLDDAAELLLLAGQVQQAASIREASQSDADE